ncbi:hypothetical protein [Neomegalonema sp.]|uniref:hypothetical protein n=1 Tax=Neomegalonema sp. TaxID=2039713 RepID=UPI00262D4818|nr:hypothetical protein [Neomegalonema sp.]MDD2869668.1 hypothetical protein [Neomegalonema sp.]
MTENGEKSGLWKVLLITVSVILGLVAALWGIAMGQIGTLQRDAVRREELVRAVSMQLVEHKAAQEVINKMRDKQIDELKEMIKENDKETK